MEDNKAPVLIDSPMPRPAHKEPLNKIPENVIQEIVKLLLEGKSITEVAELQGIHRNTVSLLIKEYRAELSDMKDFYYQEKIETILDSLLKRINDNVDNIPVSQTVVATGILLDKRKELRGRVPSQSENINLKFAFKDGAGALELNTVKSEE